jgi:hypothetical protein
VREAVALQRHCPFEATGTRVTHLSEGQTTGVITQVPFKQTFGLQGSVEVQLVQVLFGLHPGIGVKSQFPVVGLQASRVQVLLSLQTFGVEIQPAFGSQREVEHKSGGLQMVVVALHCFVAGSQAKVEHLSETWFVQTTFGLRIHCFAVSSQTLEVHPFGAGGQTRGVKTHCPVDGLQESFVQAFPSLQVTAGCLTQPTWESQTILLHLSFGSWVQVIWVLTQFPFESQVSVVQRFPSSQVFVVVTQPTFGSQLGMTQLKAEGFAL